jgi:RNA polymerase sigma factor (sigma-70 family)
VVVVQPEAVAPAPRDLSRLDEADRYLIEKTLAEPFEYVAHPLFEQLDAEKILFGGPAELRPGTTWFVETASSSPAEPGGSTLKPDVERRLFQRFNYARMRVAVILREYRGRRIDRQAVQRILGWLHRALMIRGRLAQANIPLVISMGKRSRFHGLDANEVISAGNFALLRSIDRFDCSRGFKFSTYACQGIIQRILHVVDSTRRYRSHFVSDYDETLERDDSSVRRHQAQEQEYVDELREVLATNRARLTSLETVVIQHRFGLGGAAEDREGRTLKEIGELMGVTKERVRQIQKRALEKLRSVMERECLAA